MSSFTLGTGFSYSALARDEKSPNTDLLRDAQLAIDEILEANCWTGGRENEAFNRSIRDGECFLWAKDTRDVPQIRFVEPDYVVEPVQTDVVEEYADLPAGLSWSFGVASDQGDAERRHGYLVSWEGSQSNWDFAPADELTHIRCNVDSGVKRGISDFYAPYVTLERASKLLGNTLQGSAIQATIAYIREGAGMGSAAPSITDFARSKATNIQQVPMQRGGSKTVYGEKFLSGRVIDTNGLKYHAGPLGQSNAPVYVDVMQAALRIVGDRWSMPEYVISGDASNANYSSTLVSGGPFDRATQQRQAFYKRHFADLLWKCLAHLCRRGRFAQYNIVTLAQLKREVQLKIDAPAVAVQDKEAEERIREIRNRRGVLSRQTWANEVGLDYDIEIANGAKPDASPSTTSSAAVAGALESARTTDEARAVLESMYP